MQSQKLNLVQSLSDVPMSVKPFLDIPLMEQVGAISLATTFLA